MNHTYPAKIAAVSAIFFSVYIVFSSFDLAFTCALALCLIFFLKNPLPVFVVSIILFIADPLYRSSDIQIRFITDLSIDAYILFLSAVVIYFKTRGDLTSYFSKLNKNNRKIISKEVLFPLISSIIIILLFLPILGGFLSFLAGYVIYCFITRQFNGKIAIAYSIALLLVTCFFLLIKKNSMAEELSIYVYLFLIIGTIQEVINLIIRRSSIGESELNKPKDNLLIKDIMQKMPVKGGNFTVPNFIMPKINPLILAFVITLFLLAFLLYFLYPKISIDKLSLSMLSTSLKIPSINLLKHAPSPTSIPTPTVILPTSLPTSVPTPITKVSALKTALKIKVLNGTKITGLAATTSAMLKKVGFTNVEIGNASKTDYLNWEVLYKKPDEELTGILKNILGLETLSEKEASSGAKFDIEIVIGENK